MALKKPEWPETGDLVMATVETVTDFGAYVKLDEYNKRGLLHVSEISSSWIRNIRDFVREGQKLVLKVLRVDPEKGHVDVSLRRVTKREKIEKAMAWKKERKAEGLMRDVAEKTGLPLQEIYAKAGELMDNEWGLYEGFEKAVNDGADPLIKLGIPAEIAEAILKVGQERIPLQMVRVKGTLELRCMKPNGVKIIKEAFLSAKKTEKLGSSKLRFYVIAAPKYSIEVLADNYKHAEDAFQRIAQNIVSGVTTAGGQGSFKREK